MGAGGVGVSSLRGLGQLSGSSPFKRQGSLRLEDLPSTLARRAGGLGLEIRGQGLENRGQEVGAREERLPSLPPTFSPISEDPPLAEEAARRLDLLSVDPFSPPSLPSCLSPSPHPPTLRSPLPPLPENPLSPEETSSNPWDLVPDQPKLAAAPRAPTVDTWLAPAPLRLLLPLHRLETERRDSRGSLRCRVGQSRN